MSSGKTTFWFHPDHIIVLLKIVLLFPAHYSLFLMRFRFSHTLNLTPHGLMQIHLTLTKSLVGVKMQKSLLPCFKALAGAVYRHTSDSFSGL